LKSAKIGPCTFSHVCLKAISINVFWEATGRKKVVTVAHHCPFVLALIAGEYSNQEVFSPIDKDDRTALGSLSDLFFNFLKRYSYTHNAHAASCYGTILSSGCSMKKIPLLVFVY